MKTDIFDSINQKLAPEQSVIDELLEKAEKRQFPIEPVIEMSEQAVLNDDISQLDIDKPDDEQPFEDEPRIKSRAGALVAVAAAAVLVFGIGAFLLLKSPPNVDTAESITSSQAAESLKKANTNAKLVFATVNNSCADLVADGRRLEIEQYKNTDNYRKAVRISDLENADADNWIEYSIYKAFEDNYAADGYIYFELDEQEGVTFAQWAENDETGIVGQYPDPETDPDKKHKIGQRIEKKSDRTENNVDMENVIDDLSVKIRYGTVSPIGLTVDLERLSDLEEGVVQNVMAEYGLYSMESGSPVELDFVSDARGYEERKGELKNKGDKLSFRYDWRELYGELSPGDYRMTINVNTIGKNVNSTYGFNLDFTISEPDKRISEEFDDLALSVTSVMQDSEKTELGLRLVNTSNDTDVDVVCTGTWNIFEGSHHQLFEYKNGVYKEIPWTNSKSGPAVESGSELKAGESIDLTLDLTEAYGDLSAGQYKIEFIFDLYSPDHNIDYTAPAISCEFSIPDTPAEVPDVTGMDVIEAKQMISDAGFRPIIRDQFSDDVETDKVIRTKPAAGEKTFADSEVQLLVSIGPVSDYLSKDWGLYGEVSNVTNTGCTLTLKSDGSAAAFDVSTGEEFVIGRLDESGNFEQLPLVKEAYWNAIGLTVKTGEGETTAVDINWEPYYGVLPAGMYALQKTVYASSASDGDQASRQITLTFEFEIK